MKSFFVRSGYVIASNLILPFKKVLPVPAQKHLDLFQKNNFSGKIPLV